MEIAIFYTAGVRFRVRIRSRAGTAESEGPAILMVGLFFPFLSVLSTKKIFSKFD